MFGFIVGDRFFHPYNFSLILQQVTIIGILAVAQTLIILTAGVIISSSSNASTSISESFS